MQHMQQETEGTFCERSFDVLILLGDHDAKASLQDSVESIQNGTKG